jgi:hypothetical protein
MPTRFAGHGPHDCNMTSGQRSNRIRLTRFSEKKEPRREVGTTNFCHASVRVCASLRGIVGVRCRLTYEATPPKRQGAAQPPDCPDALLIQKSNSARLACPENTEPRRGGMGRDGLRGYGLGMAVLTLVAGEMIQAAAQERLMTLCRNVFRLDVCAAVSVGAHALHSPARRYVAETGGRADQHTVHEPACRASRHPGHRSAWPSRPR